MYNKNVLDTLSLVSFIIGMANYGENLTQSDKDDMMNRLDHQMKNILIEVQKSIEEQNAMLRKIMEKLGVD